MEDDQQQVYLHFKSLSKEQLVKLILLLDNEFTYLKEIIQKKLDNT